ncbi:dimethyl sulfoxide reductase anchor subunit [Denitratisoma oestradiolicum]|uniref:Phenylacetyl-CoA:acceptor oxidoreductase n=1 Tax=Denitratisoma oestradiolicum TaxID=311182 RepID=A0A6S6YL48_9PROT|nr:dimethyl sulfoxide reductase anchor subunit [Denitratisoma oestradiolicum]TWO81274.1 hypothetical protein CBW56_03910 [Denitratisoma oestradiolicum]CAB1368454.1 Phenylacetyl-CoA:acceptor oxidoreductase [Denitratisoma oestradiolicum]
MHPTTSQPELLQGTATQWSSTAHLQTKWDWRAVGNFIGGGTGAGLLLSATWLAPSIQAYRVQAALGLVIVALGLLCIMAKMGRPTRAFNIFRHVQTSWMTREGFAMPTLFGCGALSLFQSEVGAMAVAATLSALFFLYCQARILGESKGIPAWSDPRIVPLILSTGLAEGIGLASLCSAFVPGSVSSPLAGLLLATLALRYLAWHRYQKGLSVDEIPRETFAVLGHFSGNFEVSGHGLPAALLVTGLLLGGTATTGLAATAGLIAAVTGWSLKLTLVTRAAYFYRKSFSLSALMAQGRART